MKNAVKYFSLVAIAALVLVACGKSYTPKEVADNFLKPYRKKNTTRLKNLQHLPAVRLLISLKII